MINSHPLYRLSYRGLNFFSVVRLERFELPTARFVAEYSIQLSYRRRTETLIMLFKPSSVNYKFAQSLKY